MMAPFSLHFPNQGDFLIDNQWTFEVGGRAKKGGQIYDVKDAFLVVDDAPFPVAIQTILLWSLSWLY